MKQCVFKLPFPPSLNRYWRHVGPKVLVSEEGRKYRKTVINEVLVQRVKRFRDADVFVEIDAYLPEDKRRHDLDNLLKGLLDALAKAGVYTDDSQIAELSIKRMPREGNGKLVLRITEMEPTP